MRLIDADAAIEALMINKQINEAKNQILAADEDSIIEWLKKRPSAQPQRMKGRWTRKNDGVYCSACYKGWDFMTGVPAEVETEYKFCPNCGAKRGVEDEQ